MWKEDIVLHIQKYSQNHIDAYICSPNTREWHLTCFYGHPEEDRKVESWRLIKFLGNMERKPWVCLRDFNEILSQKEKLRRLERPQQRMIEL